MRKSGLAGQTPSARKGEGGNETILNHGEMPGGAIQLHFVCMVNGGNSRQTEPVESLQRQLSVLKSIRGVDHRYRSCPTTA